MDNFTRGVAYNLRVGLNDKDLNAQIISNAEALSIIQKVCSRYFKNGFTILPGTGDASPTPSIENSFYINAVEATEKSVLTVASILNKRFNQSSILIDRMPTEFWFFTGRV
ncbi:hypothetical protein A374_15978 [Fictibacillus macauensis ZFHKF-1]|uniref:Uncharacterized protein n=1 Tax=Fictibacillus macauensis ZFHKF-1 TaxID=1196324 RepID=I8UBI4_9BACL|nr:hypothetical protein [Fictibacillus macauensis]EIT84300.1 hypothetical protein A374_15978 [Fictibacillus macauensis ZFHKF-1]